MRLRAEQDDIAAAARRKLRFRWVVWGRFPFNGTGAPALEFPCELVGGSNETGVNLLRMCLGVIKVFVYWGQERACSVLGGKHSNNSSRASSQGGHGTSEPGQLERPG